jgi:hypothetical protein
MIYLLLQDLLYSEMETYTYRELEYVYFSSSLSITDSLAKSYEKIFSDNLVISDSLLKSLTLAFTEAIAFSDAFTLTPQVNLDIADVLSITDSFDSFLTIDDDTQIVSQKTIAQLLATAPNYTAAWMPYIAIGSSNQSQPEEYSHILYDEKHRKLGEVWVRANTYFVRAVFGRDEPNADDVTVYEIGIFDADTDGNLGRRWVLATPITKDNVDELVIECAITILRGILETRSISMEDTLEISDSLTMELS